jgi:hypothetical protein
VATYVVETYLSRARAAELEDAVARIYAAIAAMRGSHHAPGGMPRHRRSYYVADDEIAYHILEASSIEVVDEISRAAGLVPDRIVEAASG